MGAVRINNAYIASLAHCQKIPVTVSPDNMRVAAGTSSAVIVSADIPTDLEDERYMLYIDICGVTYRYYFFSDPSIPWSHIQM